MQSSPTIRTTGSLLAVTLLMLFLPFPGGLAGSELRQLQGFAGVWYDVRQPGPFGPKYAGGLATYPQQISPIALYAPLADKTFFVFGGIDQTDPKAGLHNVVAAYDHATGMLSRPRVLRRVGGMNNHQAATMALDPEGHLLVFAMSHGTYVGQGNLYRSVKPYDVSAFTEIPLPEVFANKSQRLLAYANPYPVTDEGLILLFNRYEEQRSLHFATSRDGGRSWEQSSPDETRLVRYGGHYATARMRDERTLGIIHDSFRSVDTRSDLYYMQTSDFGRTWTNVAGERLAIPILAAHGPAMVHDYRAERRMSYFKHLAFDRERRPIILHLTISNDPQRPRAPERKRAAQAGPDYELGDEQRTGDGKRQVRAAWWDGERWVMRNVVRTDNNYDHGELWVGADGDWNVIGAFIDGPAGQEWGVGGQIGLWRSTDQGATWTLARQLTRDLEHSHTYPRLVHQAHERFWVIWADGNAVAESPSYLYFASRDGTEVWRMPSEFPAGTDEARPERVWPGD